MMKDNDIDILIPYDKEKACSSPVVVIAVRPETNKIDYESVIIRAVQKFGKAVYMANLNGSILRHKAVVVGHYSCQFQFAAEGKNGMKQFPEMIKKFEEKFETDFDSAPIIGSIEAVNEYRDQINLDSTGLFKMYVKRKDFLEIYGQTIKFIRGFYILNYDIPSIIKSYSDNTNILVIAVRLEDPATKFYELNYAIYEKFFKEGVIKIIDSKIRSKMEWYNQVRRTYHISHDHIESMFDLKDYVFEKDQENIKYSDTYLGRYLIDKNIFEKDQIEKRLSSIKNNPLQYVKTPSGKELLYIINAGSKMTPDQIKEKTIDECCKIFSSIIN